MIISSTSSPSQRPFLLSCAALFAAVAPGCGGRTDGFVSMGGGVGGSSATQSSSPIGAMPVVTGGAMPTGGGVATGGVISIDAGVYTPTCPGKSLSDQELTNLNDYLSRVDANCHGFTLTSDPAPPDLLLLIDTTEAMTTPISGSSLVRWQAVEQGLNDFLAVPYAGWRVAVEFYGGYRETTSIPNCGIDGYDGPSVSFDSPMANAAPIGTQLSTMGTQLTHPSTLYPALQGALLYASNWQANHLESKTAVVLVTDGRTQICDKTIADEYALTQLYSQNQTAKPIKTFVIGVAGDQANLDRIAEGGGTNRAFLVDGPDAATLFKFSLGEIIKTITAGFVCSMNVGSPGNSPSTNDPIYVRTANQLIPRVASEAECNSTDGGWYDSVDATGQKTIQFCPCSCPNASQSDIIVHWGCTLPL